MAYGSYLPEGVNIPKTALTIALLDVVVALLAGLAIFPVVFAEGLQASEGPGLIFQTLPLAFGQMPWGGFFGTLFFILLAMAAVTSAISMLEPVVEWLEERKGISRLKGALLGGVSIWFVGIGTVLSFNQWAEVYPLAFIPGFEARNLFGIFDFMVSNLMMPLGGLAIALFAGWALRRETLDQELGLEGISRKLFLIVLRFVTPLGVAWVFLYNLFG
jgi:NSS family neurotransmitter:Na+ symporter